MQMPTLADDPVPAELLHQPTQTACPTVELALIQKLGKEFQMIGADEPDILRFAWVRNVVLG